MISGWGEDVITTGAGNDVIYGDLRDMVLFAKGGHGFGDYGSDGNFLDVDGSDTEGVIRFNTFTMKHDIINAGEGDNTVFGDFRDISIEALGNRGFGEVGTQAHFNRNTWTMGSDEITVGNGNNTVYGDGRSVELFTSGAVNTSIANFAGAFMRFENHTFGGDQITSGNGADFIDGDLHGLSLKAEAGQALNGYDARVSNDFHTFTFGMDNINSGGGNDVINGDLRDLTLSSTGGHVSELTSIVPGVTIGEATALINGITINCGSDTLSGGAGNDHIRGDILNLSLVAEGGTITNSVGGTGVAVAVIQGTFTMGVDTLLGGDGNDVLFGDIETLSVVAINGTGDGDVRALFSGTFSTDTVAFTIAENRITFKGDTLDGGAGNDALAGDAVFLRGLDTFLQDNNTSDAIVNKVIWGDDMLTGGTGSDLFGFALVDDNNNVALRDGVLDGMQGHDTITDFSKTGGDKLDFFGINSVAALDAATDYVNVDATHDRIDFHGGGSIVLTGAGMGTINDLIDLAAGGTIVFNQLA